jgi:RimJ/RimL family protein N-acetyltransferase
VLHASLTDGAVTIRAFSSGDGAALVAGRDEEWARFLGPGDPDPHPVACIVVDGAVVGWVDYDHDPVHTWLEPDEVNLGYHVDAEHRRRGYATRALQLLLRHLAEETTWRTATLRIHSDNGRSVAVAERVGFTRVGEVDGDSFWKIDLRTR